MTETAFSHEYMAPLRDSQLGYNGFVDIADLISVEGETDEMISQEVERRFVLVDKWVASTLTREVLTAQRPTFVRKRAERNPTTVGARS